ncbi:XisH family protein [candidate division KSB1 bacterium]|nr:XisH family protein [candidate division KSB1 bacterium]
MPAKDLFHDTVRNALQKDGWTITHDPLFLRVGGVDVSIDLGAEKLIAAERDGEKIAVEVKSFTGPSAISEFHIALGQFLNYRHALKKKEPERILYLATPLEIYETFFTLQFVREIIEQYQLKLIVYDTSSEVIIQWLK